MQRKQAEPMERITVRIPTELRKALEAQAKWERRGFSDLVRIALEDYIDAHKQER